eukprot:6187788-Amphidinium_carterae.1
MGGHRVLATKPLNGSILILAYHKDYASSGYIPWKPTTSVLVKEVDDHIIDNKMVIILGGFNTWLGNSQDGTSLVGPYNSRKTNFR